MSNDETISRRTALKILGVGVGVASAPSVFAQHPHPHTGVEMVSPADMSRHKVSSVSLPLPR